jgi:Ca-activated chloride channel family protein
LEEAKKVAEKGIRIFTVAYGTEKGGAIPVRDGMGFLKGYKKDRQGQTILTTVKGDELRALAKAGQGSFYYASFGADHVKHIVEDLGKLEKAQFSSSVATQYEERYQLFLFLGIVLAMLEIFLGERRSSFRFWKGRFEVPPA